MSLQHDMDTNLHGYHPLWAVGPQDAHSVGCLQPQGIERPRHMRYLVRHLLIRHELVWQGDPLHNTSESQALLGGVLLCRTPVQCLETQAMSLRGR